MADVSAYAISLAFSIQTDLAILSLNEINQGVGTIQESIEKVSTIFATTFKTSITGVAEEFAKIVGSTGQISQSATVIDTAFAEALRTTADQNLQLIEVTKQLEKQNLLITKMRGWQKELGLLRDKETVKHKQHKKLGEEIAGVWDKTKKNVKNTILGFADMLIGLQAVKATFSAFLEEENKFITANYRLYGSQDEIIQQVNKTTTAYGAMRGRVLEAYTILGSVVRTGADELGELAQQNQAYSLALGVGMKEMANWQRAMKGVGWGIQDAEIALTKMTATMRQLGMTAQQMQKLLGQQADSAAEMKMMFGDGAGKVNEFNVAMIGVANSMNLPSAQVDKMQEDLGKAAGNAVAVMKMQGRATAMAGMSAAAWAEMSTGQKQAALYTSGMENAIAGLGTAYDKALGPQKVLLAQAVGLGDLSATTIDALREMSVKYKGLGGVLKMTEDEYKKLKGTMTDAELAIFMQKEATRTLNYQWTETMSGMTAAWSDLWISLKPAVMWFINSVLKPLVNVLATVIRFFAGTAAPVKKVGEAVDGLNKKAAPTVGLFQQIWNVIVGVIGGLGALAVGIVVVGAVLIGAYILWRAFMATLDVAKLLALAVAAIAVGYGFFLVAQAFGMIAELGWAMVGPLVVLAVVLAGVIIGLMLLSAAGPLVIVAAVAMAIVLLSLGLAALMVANAFAIFSDAIVALSGVDAGNLLLVGAALAAFGFLLMAAAFPLMIGGALLAVAALPLAFGLSMLAMGLDAVGDPSRMEMIAESLATFGRALGEAGAYFFVGAVALAAAAIPFVIGCAALYAGMWWLNEEKMATVSDSLLKLGQSLELMSQYDIEGLPGIAGKIVDFGESLAGIGSTLNAAVFSIAFAFVPLSWAFQMLLLVIPTINRVMTAIADAIQAGVDQINSKMCDLQTMLSPLELVAASLGLSVKALAMENIPGRVVAETVQTVKVKGDEIGAGSLERRETSAMQERQVSLLSSVNEKVDKITGANNEDVRQIRALLGSYLPKLAASPTKSSTKMNDWGV